MSRGNASAVFDANGTPSGEIGVPYTSALTWVMIYRDNVLPRPNDFLPGHPIQRKKEYRASDLGMAIFQ